MLFNTSPEAGNYDDLEMTFLQNQLFIFQELNQRFWIGNASNQKKCLVFT